MTKLQFFAAIALAAIMALPCKAVQIPLDEEHFPDENVRAWLSSLSGAVTNGMVETDKVTSLPGTAYALKIVDFSCAKYFTKLDGTLSFSYSTWTKLEKVDISGLTKVTAIDNGLTKTIDNYGGTNYKMLSMKSIIADGCTGLTSVKFGVCPNVEYASFQGCTALSTFYLYGKKLGSYDAFNKKLTALDLSASNQLSDVCVAGNKEMKTLKLSDNLPYLTKLNCSDCKIRTLNLKGLPESMNYLNVQYNRLRHIDVSANKKFTIFYYNGNALTDLDVSHLTQWSNSPNTNNQTVYCGKNTTEFVLIENLPKNHDYDKSLSGATFREEDNGKGGTRVICTFNNNVTKATYTYQPYLTNFWPRQGQAYEKAQLKVTLLRKDDPDIEERELWMVPAECEQSLTSLDKEFQLIYMGNGLYEYGSESKFMGNFRIEERAMGAATARSAATLHDFGGHLDEDTNTADTYMCLRNLGRTYQLVENSQLHFTTHPDQTKVNSDLTDKVLAVNKPKLTVDYRPEDEVRTISLASTAEPGKETTGVENVAAETTDGPVEYFDLNGLRINAADMAPGIYIRRQGSKVDKVIL